MCFCVQLGLDIEDLENNESDAGLGNGGKRFFLTLSFVGGGGGPNDQRLSILQG